MFPQNWDPDRVASTHAVLHTFNHRAGEADLVTAECSITRRAGSSCLMAPVNPAAAVRDHA
jgi:hypothetical protein